MKITTQNELAALILGARLGCEHTLNFYDSEDFTGNRHIEVSDDGCEGWRVSLNTINGEVHTGFCAEEDQEEKLNEVIRKAEEQAASIYKSLEAGE
jgi:hypothetical protein